MQNICSFTGQLLLLKNPFYALLNMGHQNLTQAWSIVSPKHLGQFP